MATVDDDEPEKVLTYAVVPMRNDVEGDLNYRDLISRVSERSRLYDQDIVEALMLAGYEFKHETETGVVSFTKEL